MSEMGRGNPSRRQALEEMTKTELELLDEARKNRHGIVSVTSGFITSQRTKGYGRRRSNAAAKLVDLGYLKFEKSHKHVYHFGHGYGTDHSFERVYSLTEEGKIK